MWPVLLKLVESEPKLASFASRTSKPFELALDLIRGLVLYRISLGVIISFVTFGRNYFLCFIWALKLSPHYKD